MFQGNQVKDVEGLAAVFAELSSSATMMSASKLLDVVAMLPGNAGEQSDAKQAYTQARFGHGQHNPVDTWVRRPKDRWPQNWHGRYNDPVVPLRLALHGHPMSGAFWEWHCREALLSVGFTPLPGWECVYMHKDIKLVLAVSVDDFKLSGAKETSRRVGT